MEELLAWTKRNKYPVPTYELILLKSHGTILYCVDVKVDAWHYLGSKRLTSWEAYDIAARECLEKLEKSKEPESKKSWLRSLISKITTQ